MSIEPPCASADRLGTMAASPTGPGRFTTTALPAPTITYRPGASTQDAKRDAPHSQKGQQDLSVDTSGPCGGHGQTIKSCLAERMPLLLKKGEAEKTA